MALASQSWIGSSSWRDIFWVSSWKLVLDGSEAPVLGVPAMTDEPDEKDTGIWDADTPKIGQGLAGLGDMWETGMPECS